LQQLFCLPPEIVKNIDTIDTNLSNLHALFLKQTVKAKYSRWVKISELSNCVSPPLCVILTKRK